MTVADINYWKSARRARSRTWQETGKSINFSVGDVFLLLLRLKRATQTGRWHYHQHLRIAKHVRLACYGGNLRTTSSRLDWLPLSAPSGHPQRACGIQFPIRGKSTISGQSPKTVIRGGTEAADKYSPASFFPFLFLSLFLPFIVSTPSPYFTSHFWYMRLYNVTDALG